MELSLLPEHALLFSLMFVPEAAKSLKDKLNDGDLNLLGQKGRGGGGGGPCDKKEHLK